MSYLSRRKDVERDERRTQRQERENAAGSLLKRVPDLASLSIDVDETRPEGCVSNNRYIRRIVVEHAPALFEIPCSYPSCEDGGYDLTREILSALSAQRTHFEGQGTCRGRCGQVDCTRVLRYVAKATYRDARTAAPAPHETTTGTR
jgi:hypothetical protein